MFSFSIEDGAGPRAKAMDINLQLATATTVPLDRV
jgi:hypothetical protein